MDGSDEEDLEFVAASVDEMEPLEATEEAFDLVEVLVRLTVIVVRTTPIGLRRDDGSVAELEREVSSRVVLIGAVYDEMGSTAGHPREWPIA